MTLIHPARPAQRFAARRREQAGIAAVVDLMLGPLGADGTAAWPNRAYLLLVGAIHDRLAGAFEDSNAGDEIVALAKALADNRRAVARAHGQDWERIGLSPSVRAAGPGAFADAIREIYGLSPCAQVDKSVETDHRAANAPAR